jgi:MFS family permease
MVDKAAKIVENEWGFGFYQFLSFLFISIVWAVGNGWYAYVSVFSSYEPKHNCTGTWTTSKNYSISNDQCFLTDLVTNQTLKCTQWSYDRSSMASTITSEYNFVCDRNHYFGNAYTLEQIGYIVGTLIFSVLADKIGRKPVLVGVLASMAVLGFIQFWIENFYVYMVFGFFINVFASGLDSVSVPLVLEMVTTKQRTGFGVGMEYLWVLIMTGLSVLAYFINTWRYLRLSIFMILAVLAVCSFWLVQESLTWLVSTCKLDNALKTIEWIGKFNRLNKSKKFKIQKQGLSESFSDLARFKESVSQQQADGPKKKLFADIGVMFAELLKYPKYRLYVLIMCLNW